MVFLCHLQLSMPIRTQQLIHELWRGVQTPQDFYYWSHRLNEEQCPTLFRNVSRDALPPESHAATPFVPDGAFASATQLLLPLELTEESRSSSHTASKLISRLLERAAEAFLDRPPADAEVAKKRISQVLAPYSDLLERLVEAHGEHWLLVRFKMIIFYPLHMSSAPQHQLLINAFECMLADMKAAGRIPPLITLSRSPHYVPLHQLRTVECGVLAVLRRVYPTLKQLDYDAYVELKLTRCAEFTAFSMQRLERLDPTLTGFPLRMIEHAPIEVALSNLSDEELLLVWNRTDVPNGHALPSKMVPSGAQLSIPVAHGAKLHVLVREKVLVEGRTIDSTLGHTQFWPITSNQVELSLVLDGIHRPPQC